MECKVVAYTYLNDMSFKSRELFYLEERMSLGNLVQNKIAGNYPSRALRYSAITSPTFSTADFDFPLPVFKWILSE